MTPTNGGVFLNAPQSSASGLWGGLVMREVL